MIVFSNVSKPGIKFQMSGGGECLLVFSIAVLHFE